MTNRTLLIILVISLAFNLAFVLSYLYHITFENKTKEQHFRPPVWEKPELREYTSRHKEQIISNRREFLEKRRAFLQQLQSEDFDRQSAEAQLDKLIAKQMQMEREMGKRLIEIRTQMSAEEAKTFFLAPHLRYRRDEIRRRK